MNDVARPFGAGADPALAPGSRLPAEATTLVGRDRELAEVRLRLEQTRLLTLAGPGGCGKTRLALRLAATAPGAVCWVELASLDDPALVAARVAAALGVPESPGRPVTPSIIDSLDGRSVLLVLDNCEHLVAACASLAADLLRALPRLRLLTTSREPLGVAGELSWPVPPLALPDPEHRYGRDVLECPAVALFLERARAARPGLAPTPDDLAVIVDLCRRLDGIPLAIELAAARLRVLSPAALADRLGADLGVLADRGRTAVGRHRTLLATMDWSYDRLPGDERRLFRGLSVFTGGFTLEAAEALGAALGVAPVLDVLSGLVERSLVAVDDEGARYRMLETVRRYAGTLLESAGEAPSARDAHAGYVAALAGVAEPGLLGPAQRDWVVRLRADHAAIGAALGWLHERGEGARGLDLAGRLGRYWWYAGHFAEGAAWLRAFLDRPEARPRGPERARALHALGLATFWHETPAAGADASRFRFEEAADIYRELGDDRALAAVLRDLGGYWKGSGVTHAARAALEESVAIARRLGDDVGVAATDVYLGIVRAYAGDVAGARARLERALGVLADRGGTDDLIRCVFFLGCLDCDAGDAARARARYTELITPEVLRSMPYTGGFGLDGLARLAAVEGEPRRALRLAGAARAAHSRLGTSAGPAYDEYARRGLDAARRELGPAAADEAYRAGLGLAALDALAEGLRRPAGPAPLPAGLSRREAEVLTLVAEGLADAEVAGRLHLSRRTVGNHLTSAYRKLGVGSRTAAVHQARVLGLL